MSILKDRSQLEFYTAALERWATIAKATGVADNLLADIVLAHAFKQAPELCKEMTEHFETSLRDSQGIKKIIDWLRAKFGMNKHADMVKVLNQFLNTTRSRGENLVDYISRFERNYAEVKKLGETFSPTCLSILLLRQAQLTDTDSQIITMNLEFDPKASNAQDNFDNCKANMKKFQHNKIANHQVIGNQPKQSATSTFIASLDSGEDFDQEQADSIKTFLGSISARGGRGGGRRGGGRGGQAGGNSGQNKKVWKCDYCICNHPRWKDCGCDCVNHRRENCPRPDPVKVEAFKKRKAEQEQDRNTKRRQDLPKPTRSEQGYLAFTQGFTDQIAQEETDYEMTLVAKITKEVEEDYQPLENLFQALNIKHVRADSSRASKDTGREAVYLEDNQTQYWQQAEETNKDVHKLSMLVDCGSPSTIVGVETFRQIKQQYPAMIQSGFQYSQSNKHYEFGGGRKTHSLGRVRLPVYVFDKNRNPHLLHVWVEVLNQQQLPLLLGSKSLTRVKGILSFGDNTLTIDWKEKKLCLPIKQESSGHYHLHFYPMSQAEESYLTREIVYRAEWSEEEIEKIVAYVALENEPQMERIKDPKGLRRPRRREPLTRNQIIHLHQALGHAHPDKIKEMVKKTKMWDDNTIKAIDDLAQCEVCAVEHNRLPRPRVSAPRAVNHNHILAIDLKENRRYRNAPPFILYFCDAFTRFKAACFINNKQGATIAEHLVTEWFKYHGAPKYIMSDRGAEFLNGEVKDLCQFHGIQYTTTASYSPHQNGLVERGHAVADRALERMMTADPSLKPQVALAWVMQAVNTMQNINGLVPFQLVFGRLPRHPSLVEENPGANEVIADSQAQWARHYRMMMSAREHFAAAEADNTLRKALRQRVFTDPTRVSTGDWIYFKRSHDRYWKGPAKVVLKDRKSLHCVYHGNPLIVNSDDVLLNKPETEEVELEDLISLPARQQPPTVINSRQADQSSEKTLNYCPETEVELTPPEAAAPALDQDVPPSVDSTASVPQIYDAQSFEQVLSGGAEAPSQVSQSVNTKQLANSDSSHEMTDGSRSTPSSPSPVATNPAPALQNYGVQTGAGLVLQSDAGAPIQASLQSVSSQVANPSNFHETDQSSHHQQPDLSTAAEEAASDLESSNSQQCPANSTFSSADLGLPLQCNLCDREISSKNFFQHCQADHNVERPNIRQHAVAVKPKPDSIYENFGKLKPGVVLATEGGEYITLERPTTKGWITTNINTKEIKNLELVRDMAEMRYVGVLDSQTEEGVNVVNRANQLVFVEFGDYTKKVFVTAQANYHEENVFVVNIPRSRHGEPACVEAKQKELRDYRNFEVFDIVDAADATDNIIATEWVLVEKEKHDGTTVTKARLCLRGDTEQALHKISRESPTVNKMSLKILLSVAVSQGWQIKTCDVERAFLQSDQIQRDVFVKPPAELNLQKGKILKLNKTAYGLVDASRAFYLKQARVLKNNNFHPLRMDPALFVHKSKGQTMCDAATAVHVDDSLFTGQQDIVEAAQREIGEKLKFGSIESLPFRFLGLNYSRGQQGELIVDCQHYVDSLEIPDLKNIASKAKQDILEPELQSTFRSLASKINVLAQTVRPDFMFAAKYLSTRYGKATKSDMTQVAKIIRRAKEEPTDIVIPNLGEPEQWILAGVVDASHRTSGSLFAVGGHVVMIINKNTLAASTIHWASKKIERVVHSSAAAETIAMQKMFSSIFFVRKVLEEMCGQRVKNLQCVALTDNQGLFSNIHHLKSNVEDFRLHSDILELRQSIEQEKTVQEVRYVHSSLNIADALTKTTKTGIMLLQVVKTGYYDLPGGTFVRNSTMSSVRTWNELMRVEQQEEERNQDKQEERNKEDGHKTNQKVLFVSVRTCNPANKLPRGTSSLAPPLSSSSQSALPTSSSNTRSSETVSTSPSTTGMPAKRTLRETRATPSLSAMVRLEENTKQLRSRFISKCQSITKTFKKNKENSREKAEDPFFDEYQDTEGNNNEDENKQKFNKKASKQRSQLADWPRQAPGSNAIGETQSQPESSEAGKSISQHAPAINRDRKADTSSDNETNKFRNVFNDF